MRLDAAGLENYKPITAPSDIAGVPYETVKSITNVTQLDKVDDTMAAVLVGSNELKTIALP